MAVLRTILVVSGCLTVVGARELPCNVTQSDGQVTYAIHGMSASANQTCHFSWSNETGSVFATHVGHDEELVKESSAGHLVTRQCLDEVLYDFSCEPQWEKISGKCKVACAEKLLVPAEVTPTPENATVHVPTVIGVTLAVVVVFLAGFGWKHRSRLFSKCWTNTMQKYDPATVKNDQDVPLNKQPV